MKTPDKPTLENYFKQFSNGSKINWREIYFLPRKVTLYYFKQSFQIKTK